MAVKSKTKSKASAKSTVKSKAVKKSTKAAKAKAVKKAVKPKAAKATVATQSKTRSKAETPAKKVSKKLPEKTVIAAPKSSMPVVKRNMETRHTPVKRSLRPNQYTYMKAPGSGHAFDVGDTVEVFCDHEKSRERIRGWIKGIVVQVDYKMVAVQFRSNVFLTDGWMVPDRILWYPLNSEHIRAMPGKKSAIKKDLIPDY